MDAFASIALATTPHGPKQPTTSTVEPRSADGHRSKRQLKRARSEKPCSPDWPRKRACTEARPATSYEQSPEDRKLEAELLLNFAQEAAKLVSPSPVLHHVNIPHTQAVSETTNHGRFESNGYDQKSIIQQHASKDAQTLDYTKIGTDQSPLQEHDATMHETGNTYRPQTVGPTKMNLEIGHAIPITSDNVRSKQRTISPETSKDDDVGLTGDTGGLEQGVATGLSDRSYVSDPQSYADVSSLDAKAHIEDNSVEQNLLDGDCQIPTDLALQLNDTSQTLEDAVSIEDGDPRLKGEPVEEGMPPEVEKLPEESIGNESRTVHGPLSDQGHIESGRLSMAEERPAPSPQEIDGATVSDVESNPGLQGQPKVASAVCTACSLTRNTNGIDMENNSTSWISCDACKSWFHFACAGFKSEREVRGVDKFKCRRCKPVHGPTTYVRKSSRAHSAIDYAGLHQGVIKTSDERPEHHYIKPIKEGTISFQPENFARMRPELVTAEFFEKGTGMREPIVIPACLNPRSSESTHTSTQSKIEREDIPALGPLEDDDINTEWFSRRPESESVPDHGQDALDMVIPQGLTVRQVAELYGPEEKVEVIDVKSQNGENKKWNMRRWADYYENPNNKVVRNVISLEVSQSKLGRLIRRPQIVRDLDLQDSVWPEELLAKGEYPRVQFYTLMSVADCFTDFHIDFGGSSVFYHILKGKKTFLFIPPKEKYLKKYEEWCMSPAQNWTFLGNQTKECYRVDLSEGDTMLIPSGWIHAVWTPEDSLVIGGNFLTRMNFGMQLRVAQVEKATGVARKFRYPHFQKLHWYTVIQYLEMDPLPSSVRDMLHAGGSFHREQAAYYDFDYWGENSRAGPENYHVRYYSQLELEGLPDLLRYLLRTALIDTGSITDGISADTRNAVKKSIPRGHGEPLDVMKAFAAWCAWKRGNEPIPHWAYPDAVPENLSPDKLSAAATKKLDREAALLAPRRQSARMQSQQEAASAEVLALTILSNTSPGSVPSSQGLSSTTPKRPRPQSGAGVNSHRKTACESCRKRRRACKHKGEVASFVAASATNAPGLPPMDHQMMPQITGSPSDAGMLSLHNIARTDEASEDASATNDGIKVLVPDISTSPQALANTSTQTQEEVSASQFRKTAQESNPEHLLADSQISGDAISSLDTSRGYSLQARPRHKACNECRKSKVGSFSPVLTSSLTNTSAAPMHTRCIWQRGPHQGSRDSYSKAARAKVQRTIQRQHHQEDRVQTGRSLSDKHYTFELHFDSPQSAIAGKLGSPSCKYDSTAIIE